MSDPLPKELYEELGSAVRGELYQCDDPSFGDYSTIFNGNVTTSAKAVVCPLDADDVSRIVRFCNKHGLSLSVKAGGYGTAGWAIGGDIIVDVSKIDDLDIETPHEDGSFTSLRDVASAHSKGKKAVTSFAASTGKRRREEDAKLRVYDSASFNVASFLRGQPLVIRDGPSPANRRRVDAPSPPVTAPVEAAPSPIVQDAAMTLNVDSVSGSGSPSGGSRDQSTQPVSPREQSASTLETSPSPPAPGEPFSMLTSNTFSLGLGPAPFIRDADPFGYLNEPTAGSQQAPFSNFPATNTTSIVADWRAAVNEGSPDGDHSRIDLPSRIEPVHPHAFVTFGAGKRQKEIDTYTAQNRLEAVGADVGVPYHVPFSAHPVGSSIMLLGGFGFMSRLRGLSIDNLVEVEMVLADGRIVVVSENEHPDLWWALRGAGPALGIATRYKAKAFPVSVVFAGNLIYRFNRATAPSLIKHFRDCIKGAPRELYANLILTAGPPGKDSLVVIQFCYMGPREKGQEYLAAISSWDGEQCLLNEVDEKSFLHQQDSVAQVLRGKAGRQWYIRSSLITSLPDDIVNDTVTQFSETPVGCTWLFELAGGAIADFEDTCVPKSQREAPWTVAALHQWEMKVNDLRCVDSAEEWIAETLKPVHNGGPFPSFLGRHEPPERTRACFGSNWERLSEIKSLYDPTNVFRNSLWPLNAQGELVAPETHEPPTPRALWTTLRPAARAEARSRAKGKARVTARVDVPVSESSATTGAQGGGLEDAGL